MAREYKETDAINSRNALARGILAGIIDPNNSSLEKTGDHTLGVSAKPNGHTNSDNQKNAPVEIKKTTQEEDLETRVGMVAFFAVLGGNDPAVRKGFMPGVYGENPHPHRVRKSKVRRASETADERRARFDEMEERARERRHSTSSADAEPHAKADKHSQPAEKNALADSAERHGEAPKSDTRIQTEEAHAKPTTVETHAQIVAEKAGTLNHVVPDIAEGVKAHTQGKIEVSHAGAVEPHARIAAEKAGTLNHVVPDAAEGVKTHTQGKIEVPHAGAALSDTVVASHAKKIPAGAVRVEGMGFVESNFKGNLLAGVAVAGAAALLLREANANTSPQLQENLGNFIIKEQIDGIRTPEAINHSIDSMAHLNNRKMNTGIQVAVGFLRDRNARNQLASTIETGLSAPRRGSGKASAKELNHGD